MLALSLNIPKKWPTKTVKIAVVDNPLSFDVHSPGNHREYPHKPIARK